MRRSEHAIDLKGFSRRGFEALGAVVEAPDHDSLEVLLPDEWATVPCFGNRDFLRLRFSSEGPSGRMALGSAPLEALTAALSGKGWLSRAYLNPLRIVTGKLEAKLDRAVRFANARPALRRHGAEETAHAVFNFKVVYLADDQHERLYRVAVNLTTFLENEGLDRQWDHLFFEDEPGYSGLPLMGLTGLDPAYQRAGSLLRRGIAEDLGEIRRTQDNFLRRDLLRVDRYYGTLLSECLERERRCEGDEAVLERLARRKKAIELERRKKAGDAQAKYRLEVRAELLNVLIVYQPWVRAVFSLRSREGEMERAFYWDPILKEFWASPCELCREAGDVLFVQDGKLVCFRCRRCMSA